jgi:hypothetical protein
MPAAKYPPWAPLAPQGQAKHRRIVGEIKYLGNPATGRFLRLFTISLPITAYFVATWITQTSQNRENRFRNDPDGTIGSTLGVSGRLIQKNARNMQVTVTRNRM